MTGSTGAYFLHQGWAFRYREQRSLWTNDLITGEELNCSLFRVSRGTQPCVTLCQTQLLGHNLLYR